jgi:osmotically inducible lipoprotein OsmB
MIKIKYLILVVLIALPIAGCTNMSKTQQGTLSGGVIGGAAGAGITAIAGGNPWVGGAIGAGAGALTGYIISK